MATKIRDMHVGDKWPPHYFRLFETYFDSSTGDVKTKAMDLDNDYQNLKYVARCENNKNDKNDDTKSDINGVMAVVAGTNLCYYTFGTNDLPATKVGKWTVKIYLEKKTTGEPMHLLETFEFTLRHKHPVGLASQG